MICRLILLFIKYHFSSIFRYINPIITINQRSRCHRFIIIFHMESKYLAVLLAILGAVSVLYTQYDAKPELTSFENWMNQYNVKYDSMFERAYRERIFLENLAKIESHNSGKHQYSMGVNQFTAMTQQQFVSTFLGLIPTQTEVEIDNHEHIPNADVDWKAAGAVTPVKNQGQCGSCWAFSTTGALEGLSKLGWGDLQNFSEQQLVDCSSSYGNQGCNGGLMSNAFKYVHDKGITLEAKYPYKGVGGKCQVDGGDFKVSGHTNITNCNDLTNWLSKGVVSVAVDATNWSPYKTGVFSNCRTSLNHGVTLTGSKDGNWVIKNSWGTSWGEQGYITLKGGNTCGVCNMASVPNK